MFHTDSIDNSEMRDPVFTGFDDDALPYAPEEKQTVPSTRRPGLKSLVLVAGLAALAGVSPWLIPNPAPATYTTSARVGVDTKADSSPETRALIQDHIGILTSQASLDRVVRDLDLAADASFDTRKQSGMDRLLDLVLGKEKNLAQTEAARRELLERGVRVAIGPGRDQVTISVTAPDARQSARITNHMATLLVGDMAQTSFTGVDHDLEKRRIAIGTAQADLTAFISAENPTSITDARRLTSDIAAIDNQLDLSQARLIALENQAGDVKSLTLADITDKVSSAVTNMPMLADLHQKYVVATMSVDQLSAALGPRHPRLLAAQSAVAQVRKDIQVSLGRLNATIQEQIKANGKDVEAYKAKRASLVEAQQQTGVDVARMQTLETTVDTARKDYLDYVQRSENSAPKSHTIAATVLSSAAPAEAVVSGVSRSALSASAALAGLGLGLCILMIRMALRPNAPPLYAQAETQAQAQAETDLEAEVVPDLSIFEPGFLSDFVLEPIEPMTEIRPALDLQHLPQREARYMSPANTSPLADHIRDVLQGGVYSSEAAVDKQPFNEDIRDLRLEMAALRERVEVYATRRSSGRG